MLGIFQGKKAKNNKLILKSLVSGAKTTTQIAEYLLSSKRALPSEQLNKQEVENKVSIISRRNEKQKGRLHELETKQYIEREGRLWRLTKKGLPIALTLFNNTNEALQLFDPSFKLYLQSMVRNVIARAPLGEEFLFNRKWLAKILSQGAKQNCLHLLPVLRESANDLKRESRDLDNMGRKKFSKLLVDRLVKYYIGLD